MGQGSRPRRIIPARAGFTTPQRRRGLRRPDHPRSRGVYGIDSRYHDQYGGSSPLARGLPADAAGGPRRRRIIPARAGFTSLLRSGGLNARDHPRSRGVYEMSPHAMVWLTGSSPLARGLLRHGRLADGRAGIIPARAGFTCAGGWSLEPESDHPRSRGVYVIKTRKRIHRAGSSPLARGLRHDRQVRSPRRGIIPARAGFTGRRSQATGRLGDHPRSRGVYAYVHRVFLSFRGSSPLARGLHHFLLAFITGLGIIPARAGFTRPRRGRSRRRSDHPRSRGVYHGTSGRTREPAGSSPLARGLPRSRSSRFCVAGIIPARAGFTPARRQEIPR